MATFCRCTERPCWEHTYVNHQPPQYPPICLQPWYYSLSAWQAFAAIIVWPLIIILGLTNKTIWAVKVEESDQPWLTSKRRYSFCSWESRLRMTPAAARVRTPIWTLVRRAGRDHKSWNWTWLRPSKENSGATCQSKTNTCWLTSALVWEIHKAITVRSTVKVDFVRQSYYLQERRWGRENTEFPSRSAPFVNLKIARSTENLKYFL